MGEIRAPFWAADIRSPNQAGSGLLVLWPRLCEDVGQNGVGVPGCCFINRDEKRERRLNGGQIAQNATEEDDQKTRAAKAKDEMEKVTLVVDHLDFSF